MGLGDIGEHGERGLVGWVLVEYLCEHGAGVIFA